MARYPALDGLRIKVLAGICHHGMRFFDSSYKITWVVAPGARPYLENKAPAVFALYHGRMVGMLRLVWPRDKTTILVSRSRDGEIVARALEQLGYSLGRGSPAHRPVEGAVQMVKAARAGQHLAVMVDGPRGPIYNVKPGVVRLAQLAGLPIVPFVCFARSQWWFWGWDRFMGPLWSTPMVYVVGEPIPVPAGLPDDGLEAVRAKLEQTMCALRQAADSYFDYVG